MVFMVIIMFIMIVLEKVIIWMELSVVIMILKMYVWLNVEFVGMKFVIFFSSLFCLLVYYLFLV